MIRAADIISRRRSTICFGHGLRKRCLYLVLLLNKLNSLTIFVLFTRRHVISVSVTLYSCSLYAHSWVRPDAHTHTHTQTYAHTQMSPLPLVFVNIKPQNDYLNMTSACLCVNVWRRRMVLFATHTEACARLAVILTSAASLNEDINTEHIQNCSESHFMSIWPFHFSKTILTQKSKRYSRQPVKIKVWVSIVDIAAEIYYYCSVECT